MWLCMLLLEPPKDDPLTGIHVSLPHEDLQMGGKRKNPEDIVLKLRQGEILKG